jgi:hypothetical protein
MTNDTTAATPADRGPLQGIPITDDAVAVAAPPVGAPPVDPMLIRGLRAAMSAQRPAVLLHIRSIRRQYPAATPDQVVRILERRFLNSITLTGAGSGAATLVPGIGTAIGITVIGVETVAFFEMTALFAQSVAEIHGIVVDDEERAHNLVMALMLGGPGKDLVQQFVGQATGVGPDRTQYWGESITAGMPKALVGLLNKRLRDELVKRMAVKQGGSMVGRLIPFGIGAVIGGAGNRIIGGKVVQSAQQAFGPAPAWWPAELEQVTPTKAPRLRRGRRRKGSTPT